MSREVPNRNPSPVGFPIVLDPEDVAALVAAKVAMDAATAGLEAIAVQGAALQREAERLTDERDHAATGIRIKARALAVAHELPDAAAIVIDADAGTVEFIDRQSRRA